MAGTKNPYDRDSLDVPAAGGAFSRAPMSKIARVHLRDVEPLIRELDLGDDQTGKLTAQIRRVVALYLGKVGYAEKIASHARSLELLPQIARHSDDLAKKIRLLDQAVLQEIESHRREPHDEEEPPLFDMLVLTRMLTRLAHAVERTNKLIMPRARGRQRNEWLDEVIDELLIVFEEAGLPVEPLNSGSMETRRQLKGRGGELLVAIFRKFDPHTDEPQLWGAVTRVRKSRKAAAARQ